MLLSRFLEQSAQLYPDKVALICCGKRITYAEIDRASNSLGNAIIETGFRRQERGIVFLDNSIESVVSIFGILKAGGIFVVLNSQIKAKKLEYILSDCQARLLVTDSKHISQISRIISNLPSLEHIIITDYDDVDPVYKQLASPDLLSYKTIIEQHSPDIIAARSIDIDLAGLIYTSGSSGNPKGVMLTHHNMESAANSVIQYLENNSDDIIMSTLPLSFSYGLYQIITSFKCGATVVLGKSFIFPEQIINLVVREKVTGWPMVPTIIALLLKMKNLDKHDYSCLRYITSASQTLPIKHIAQLREIFPAVKIYSMYGLTECKRVSYLPPEQLDKRPGSVGKAMPNTEVFIVDENGKEITEAETSGELVVRGANVMKGYWNLPEETAKALRPGIYPDERVLYTGDIFQKDNEGFLYFLGRRDDIIKVGGQRVIPIEVENVLCEMKDVVEAAVIGVEDDVLGQSVKAFVNLADSSKINEKDIITFCHKHLEPFAVPKHVVFRKELPKTESGKVKKQELR